MRQAYIIVVLLVTVLLIFGACTPKPAPTPNPEPTAEEPLAAPELVSPHNRTTDIEQRPILLWQAVPEAVSYKLKVSRDSDFSDIVVDMLLFKTSYELSEYLSPLTRYYWMVGAKRNTASPDDPVAYSEVWSFTTVEKSTSSEPTTPLQPPPIPEPTPSPEPIPITAAQLSTEYDEIGLAAETQYKWQTLEVSGTFDYFDFAIGKPYISFETDPDAWEIRAFLADDQVSQAQTLAKGDEIVVLGECHGSSGWYRIILADCRFITP